jgi:hypothetical protein
LRVSTSRQGVSVKKESPGSSIFVTKPSLPSPTLAGWSEPLSTPGKVAEEVRPAT